MTIEKLPSGSYRVKQMIDGKRYAVTVPYKPSKKEAFDLIQDKIHNRVDNTISFRDAAEEYLRAKSTVLSPSTVRGYRSIMRNLPTWFMDADLAAIDRITCQKLVNEYNVDHSPKSTINVNGFVQTVIHLYYPDANVSVTLPQRVKKNDYIPSHDDVMKVMDELRDTVYYVPLHLAALSLRLSEICALTIDDLNGNVITVNKALIRADGGYVLKPTPKTDASNRVVVLPPELAERIREQGFIYEGYPNQIYKCLTRTSRRLGIPHFSFHKLRHFFASYAHELGYSDSLVMELGGWNSDVMKRVYRHAMNVDEAKQSVASDFSF